MTNSTTNSFRPIPLFGILSYKTAVRFYVGFLGFQIDWENRIRPTDLVSMQLLYNGLILHLSELKKFKANAIIFVGTFNIQAFHADLKQRNLESNIQDIQRTTWKTMQLEIEDPFGNLLRFNENVTDYL